MRVLVTLAGDTIHGREVPPQKTDHQVWTELRRDLLAFGLRPEWYRAGEATSLGELAEQIMAWLKRPRLVK